MSKKVVSLTEEQADIVRYAVCDGPGWLTPKEQWRQMRLIGVLEAAGQGAIELETTSPDRKAIIKALEDPRVVGALKGKALPTIWAAKVAFGWKQPDIEDLDDDEEEAD